VCNTQWINRLWLKFTRSPRWRGPHHASLQVRLPASTLAYRVHCTLIADYWIKTNLMMYVNMYAHLENEHDKRYLSVLRSRQTWTLNTDVMPSQSPSLCQLHSGYGASKGFPFSDMMTVLSVEGTPGLERGIVTKTWSSPGPTKHIHCVQSNASVFLLLVLPNK
jgi:hypothetical protein